MTIQIPEFHYIGHSFHYFCSGWLVVGWVGGELESNAKHSFQLLGQKNVGQQKNLGPKSWVKIRSVTAEIMLIWTIVARTYVD